MNDEPRMQLPALQSGGAIRAIIPQTFEEAWRIASAVAKAGMAPKGLSTPEQCTIAILHGLEVGMPPMMALQSIALINGRPTIWGDGAMGLVQASGKLQTIKESIEGSGDNRTATCRLIRVGDPEPKTGRFSMGDAKKAGLLGKQGPWTTYPDRMLQMRARSWALRDGFADVLKGLSIAEEVRDYNETRPMPPTPPSLSQPLKPALGAAPPVSSVMRAPTPPKPPSVKATIEEKIVRVEERPEAFEPEEEIVTPDGEVVTPGQMLSDLDEALAYAESVERIEEIWNEHDIEAKLAHVSQGEQFVGVAWGIKRRHLKRIGG